MNLRLQSALKCKCKSAKTQPHSLKSLLYLVFYQTLCTDAEKSLHFQNLLLLLQIIVFCECKNTPVWHSSCTYMERLSINRCTEGACDRSGAAVIRWRSAKRTRGDAHHQWPWLLWRHSLRLLDVRGRENQLPVSNVATNRQWNVARVSAYFRARCNSDRHWTRRRKYAATTTVIEREDVSTPQVQPSSGREDVSTPQVQPALDEKT